MQEDDIGEFDFDFDFEANSEEKAMPENTECKMVDNQSDSNPPFPTLSVII